MSRKARLLILPALLAPLLAVAACEFPHQPGSDEEDPVAKTVRERHERNAYSVPPRDYPSQTNTSPVGWQPPAANPPASPPGASQQAVAAAPMPPPAQPPMPANKPLAPPATAQPAKAMAEPNPPLPAGYVPSVPAPAGAQASAQASAPAMAAMPTGTMPGVWLAHIASHRSEEAAINDWQRRLKENPAVYGELEPALLWADIPNRGSYARLVFGNFASKADAQAACGKISGPGRYCNVIQEKP